jgi:hypothetical protein
MVVSMTRPTSNKKDEALARKLRTVMTTLLSLYVNKSDKFSITTTKIF